MVWACDTAQRQRMWEGGNGPRVTRTTAGPGCWLVLAGAQRVRCPSKGRGEEKRLAHRQSAGQGSSREGMQEERVQMQQSCRPQRAASGRLGNDQAEKETAACAEASAGMHLKRLVGWGSMQTTRRSWGRDQTGVKWTRKHDGARRQAPAHLAKLQPSNSCDFRTRH